MSIFIIEMFYARFIPSGDYGISFGSDEPSSNDGVVLCDTPVVMIESITTFTLELLERYEK